MYFAEQMHADEFSQFLPVTFVRKSKDIYSLAVVFATINTTITFPLRYFTRLRRHLSLPINVAQLTNAVNVCE